MGGFKINCWRWSGMGAAERERLLRRAEVDITGLMDVVRPIVDAVRECGDAAVAEYTDKFDGARMRPGTFRAKKADFEAALTAVGKPLRDAIEKAAANVESFHRKQMPHGFWMAEIESGVYAGEKITPIDNVGLYVPRGKGAFPSVMVMLATPARVAGSPRIAAFSPPTREGKVDDATLAAARICGIDEVYGIGGAQAIAAMAFGTQSVPKVDKVVGPGSGYVAAAKRLLYGTVDVGLPAGPSESIILADAATDAETAAMDLLIEAEHGPDSAAILVTDSEALAKEVMRILPKMAEKLPEPRRGFVRAGLGRYGGIVVTDSRRASIEFSNRFAPEHLEILLEDPFDALRELRNAGEILVGRHTPITTGNYNLGVDAILPTGGFARTYSGVSVFEFMKRSSVGYLTEEGLERLGPSAVKLARYEGFPAHAAAVEARMRKTGKRGGKKR